MSPDLKNALLLCGISFGLTGAGSLLRSRALLSLSVAVWAVAVFLVLRATNVA